MFDLWRNRSLERAIVFASLQSFNRCVGFSFLAPVFISLMAFGASAQQLNAPFEGHLSRTFDDLGPASVAIGAPTLSRTTPSTFVVSISMNDPNAANIEAFQFNLSYNSAVIDPVGPNFGCSTTGTVSGAAGIVPVCNILPDGNLRVSSLGAGTIVGSGTILNITFSTDSTAVAGNVSNLMFSDIFFFNSNGPVHSPVSNGSVTLVLAPTAAGVFVGGQVVSADGLPIRNSRLTLADASGVVRTATSNPFGHFRFEDVPSGASYLLSVRSKTFIVAPRVLTVTDELTDLMIIAEP